MIRTLAGICLSSFACLSLVRAQSEPEPLKLLTGVVAKIDDKALTLVRRTAKGPDAVFPFAKDLKILIQTDEDVNILGKFSPKNAPGKVSDVKPGQRVTIAFRPGMELVEIVVLRGKNAKKT